MPPFGSATLANGLRLLVVDDDEMLRRTYARVFPKQKLLLAANGREALARIPRLSIVDLPLQPRCCGAAGSYFIENPGIADALRAFGVEVWFDQNELRGGDTWDQKIRTQIKTCALFVPLVSAQTEERTDETE